MRYFKLSFCIFSFLGLFSCGQKEVKNIKAKEAQTLTLIKFGLPDSINDQNKGLNIHSYTYIDLNNDSVSAFFKIYKGGFNAKPEIRQISGFINGIGKDGTLVEFFQQSQTLPLRKTDSPTYLNSSHSTPIFVLVTQTGNQKKVLLSHNYEYNYKTDFSLKQIERLVHSNRLKKVNLSLNEDSVLASLFKDPEFINFSFPESSPTYIE